MINRSLLCLLALLLNGTLSQADEAWPEVKEAVPAEQFTQQMLMLREGLGKFRSEWLPGGQKVDAATVQTLLDKYCIGALVIPKTGTAKFIRALVPPSLVEQGWAPTLLKVINERATTTTLRINSPNAGRIAGEDASAAANRWLDVDFVTSLPFSPNLSGVSLEYRLVNLYSSTEGRREADFSLSLGQESSDPAQRFEPKKWSFDGVGVDGWTKGQDCDVDTHTNVLKIIPTGLKPQIYATVEGPAGQYVLNFRAKNSGSPQWKVSIGTGSTDKPDWGEPHELSVFADNGGWNNYTITHQSEYPIVAVRIAPGEGSTAASEVDDITLIKIQRASDQAIPGKVLLLTEAAHELKLSILDEKGKPCTASLEIRDRMGRLYPWPGKRLEPDFFFQRQIYRKDGESIKLPAGEYTAMLSRGPESLPKKEVFAVVKGANNILEYRVKRWVDPAMSGWISGDHHIHAAGCQHYDKPTQGVRPEAMQRHIEGEDLKIGCNLTWGPCFDFQKQFFTGRIDEVSKSPYLLRYDLEVSGFGSHESGHLCLLGLKEQIFPGGDSKHHWPTLGLNTLKWAKKQGAICGPAHSTVMNNGSAGRVEGVADGPNGLPNFAIPKYDGIGAVEYVVDITHQVPGPDGQMVQPIDFISTMDTNRHDELNIWYHTLNCGFRIVASGETDFPCITGERVGGGRVYVHTPAPVTFEKWLDGLAKGRSYVSDGFGHLMGMKVNGVKLAEKNELALEAPSTVVVTARSALILDRSKTAFEVTQKVPVELIVNGYPVAYQEITASGNEALITLSAEITRSSWVALRIFPHVHTNPVFVTVGGQPFKPVKNSAKWMRQSVDQVWKMKGKSYRAEEKAEAEAAYQHARETYDRLITEGGE